jgi:hypothetical protein
MFFVTPICIANQVSLDGGIVKLQYLVSDLKNFNKQQWEIRYPCLSTLPSSSRQTRERCVALYDQLLTR